MADDDSFRRWLALRGTIVHAAVGWIAPPLEADVARDLERVRARLDREADIARVRDELEEPSLPALLNTQAELERWSAEVGVPARRYPLMKVERVDASTLALLVYLLRLCWWRLTWRRAERRASRK